MLNTLQNGDVWFYTSEQHTYKHEVHYGTGNKWLAAISGCSGDHKAGWLTIENKIKKTHVALSSWKKKRKNPSHHKNVVLIITINLSKSMCDIEGLDEIWHLRETFRQNGYSTVDFHRAIYLKHKATLQKKRLIGVGYIIVPADYIIQDLQNANKI
jgi:hypothetical protein